MQFKQKIPIVIIFVFFVLTATYFIKKQSFVGAVFAQTPPVFIFLNDLRPGDSGRDVLELQKVLNADIETRVSFSGVGSSGFETEYFGPATTDAVIRFQNKYSDEVLRPAGLYQGSGFVGLWTKLKLNQILLKASVGQATSSSGIDNAHATIVQSFPLPVTINNEQVTSFEKNSFVVDPDELVLSYPSLYAGKAGTTITLSGYGFSLRSNTVYFGKNKIKNVVAKNPNTLIVNVPNIPVGRYDVSVSNGSSKDSGTIPFMVTNYDAKVPVVESISPSQVRFGEEITITGRNFSTKDNIIATHLGTISGVKSIDGNTLTFTIPIPEYLQIDHPQIRKIWFGGKDNLYWQVNTRVVNENGISENPQSAKFIINI